MNENKRCETCKHYLGGGCCRINVEDECEAGGGYECWEPRMTKFEKIFSTVSIVLAWLLAPMFYYKLYMLIFWR